MPTIFDDFTVPSPVADALRALITQRSAFISSGGALVETVSGASLGGHQYTRPRWNEDGTRAEIIDGTSSTPTVIGTSPDIAPVTRRKRVRTSVDGVLASIGLLSQDPNQATLEQSAAYWAAEIDSALVAVCTGLFDGSAGALRTTHRRTVATTAPTAVVPISYAQVVRAASLLGDNLLDLSVLVVHSMQWADLALEVASKGLIHMIPAPQGNPIPYLGTMRVVLSDNVPTSGSGSNKKYTGFLVAPGALFLAIQQDLREFKAVKAEVPSTVVTESLHFAPGVGGCKYTGTTLSPTNVELATAADWSKSTTNDKLIRIVALETNASA